jgi:DNA-binding protein H-NS
MKKVFLSAIVAGMMAMVACGPSAEEKAAAEKAKQDSIAAVEAAKAETEAAAAKATADSIAAVEAAAKQKAIDDSIAAAAAAPKKGGKATSAPKKTEPKKGDAGSGRG